MYYPFRLSSSLLSCCVFAQLLSDMKKLFLLLAFWVGWVAMSQAQTEYRLALSQGRYSAARDTLCLDVMLAFDQAGALGSANLVMRYDPAHLGDPTLRAAGDLDPNLFTSVMLTQFAPGKAALNFELMVPDSGQAVPGSQDSLWLGTVCFVVTNAYATHQVDWYEQDTRGTVLYLANESTRLRPGNLQGWTAPRDTTRPEPGLIAFVTKDAAQPTAGDRSVIEYLEAMGHTVELLGESSSTTADAQGKDLIYIASTVLSGRVGARFRDVSVPVIVGESHLFDDMKMTDGNGHYGNTAGLTEIEVTDVQHPIAEGLSQGPLTVFAPADRGVWGRPSSEAFVLGHWPGNSGRKLLFAYDAGQAMVGMNAPARRVGFFLHDGGLRNATEATEALLANVVCWAMGSNCGSGDPALAVGNPYGGTPWPIPGLVQAEDFDEGGQGMAYHDHDGNNHGGQYRQEGVDVQTTRDDGGGYNVGWIRQDEWLDYTVDVQAAGDYRFAFRVAARSNTGKFHLSQEGRDLTGEISFAPTGDWQAWTTVYAGPVTLAEGPQVIRLHMDASSFNFNHFEATRVDRGAATPQTQTITLSPIHDAYLQNGARRDQSILRIENGSHRQRTTFLRFDLSQLPGPILDASLDLTCVSDPGHGPMTVSLGGHSNWTEDNLSTSNRPMSAQLLATRTGSYDRDQGYTWELGALANRGDLTLVMDQLSGNDAAFAAKEYGNPSYRPQLVLTVETGQPLAPLRWSGPRSKASPARMRCRSTFGWRASRASICINWSGRSTAPRTRPST